MGGTVSVCMPRKDLGVHLLWQVLIMSSWRAIQQVAKPGTRPLLGRISDFSHCFLVVHFNVFAFVFSFYDRMLISSWDGIALCALMFVASLVSAAALHVAVE